MEEDYKGKKRDQSSIKQDIVLKMKQSSRVPARVCFIHFVLTPREVLSKILALIGKQSTKKKISEFKTKLKRVWFRQVVLPERHCCCYGVSKYGASTTVPNKLQHTRLKIHKEMSLFFLKLMKFFTRLVHICQWSGKVIS